MYIATVYRPPSGSVTDFLEIFDNLLQFLGEFSRPFLILGDINRNAIANDGHAREFRDILNQYARNNEMTLPTSASQNSATSIDICVTNVLANKLVSGAFIEDISDHLPIFSLRPFMHKNTKQTETLFIEI